MPDNQQKDMSRIRNFCIIAHIDHGKSTLADRILEKTQAISLREMENQLLDNMDLERERGITIKARAVKVQYQAQDGNLYEFNLIDTPGHVDFNYEVSRSLAACEGALLVVDASQGIEAQTLANTYLAVEHNLEVVPVVNKVDLPSANPDMVCHEIEDIIGIPALDAPRISAKTGLNVEQVLERIVTDIPAPAAYIGTIMELSQERRGTYKDTKYLDTDRVELHYELPLNEIVYDFFDALKSRTKGYASFDYEFAGYQQSKLVKLDIMISGEVVDALSFIVHADRAYARARKMAEKLKENIPRQMFEVPIQAAIGGKIIARETVKAFRKDVLAKCYGGDITRKKKLLEKQKEGKKRMRQLGSVEVPQEAFMAVLKLDE